jgi:hypothetical protein
MSDWDAENPVVNFQGALKTKLKEKMLKIARE